MKIADQNTSAVSLVKAALEKAHQYQADYHIFTFINDENALKKAAEIDARIANGEEVGKLAGVPYALKDNFLSPEGETTASALILHGFKSPATATAVKKLEAEGAIMIGRTNLTLLLMARVPRTAITARQKTAKTSSAWPEVQVAARRWLWRWELSSLRLGRILAAAFASPLVLMAFTG